VGGATAHFPAGSASRTPGLTRWRAAPRNSELLGVTASGSAVHTLTNSRCELPATVSVD
jgi:hypothetical protein